MKKKLFRITTVSPSLSTLLKGQLRFLSDYYEVVGIASGKNELDIVSKREAIRTVNIPMSREISLWQDLRSCISLIFLFMKERPYIVHANTPKASLISMVAAWLVRVPHRIYMVTGLRFETTTGTFRKMLIFMEMLTCWCATKVIPEGSGVKKTLLREGITNKPLKVILHGNINGIDLEYFNRTAIIEQQAAMIMQGDVFTFCFVGRLVKDKGMNELVHAFIRVNQIYPNTRLLLVGPFEKELDPLLPEVEHLILCHSSICFVGFQFDVRPFFAASDLFVFPSYREGFPNVVLQAGAMGLPSIVTDISGSNEIIENGVNGIIIPSRNEDALFDAMNELYSLRKTKVLQMAKNARPMIVNRFDQQSIWQALLKEYQSLDNV